MQRRGIRNKTLESIEGAAEGRSAVQDSPVVQLDELPALGLVVRGRPLGLVVVDYVQNLRPANGYENRKKHEQIFYSTKRLKDLG